MIQSTLLLTILGLLVAFTAIVAALVFRYRDAMTRRIQSVFRRAEKPSKPPGPNHYYKPYWS